MPLGRAGPGALGRADDRRGRGAAVARQPLRRHRPLPARGGGAVRARGAPRNGPRRLAGDRAALRRAVRAHRLAGGGAQPRRRAGARRSGAAAGLAALDALAADARLADYQPYWAARAELLARSGDAEAAAQAYEQAIGLERDPAVRRFLQQRAAALARGTERLEGLRPLGGPLTPTLSPECGGEGAKRPPSPACGRGLGVRAAQRDQRSSLRSRGAARDAAACAAAAAWAAGCAAGAETGGARRRARRPASAPLRRARSRRRGGPRPRSAAAVPAPARVPPRAGAAMRSFTASASSRASSRRCRAARRPRGWSARCAA